jgi:hypothetical protein
MTNNRKKGIRIAGALFIILLCALGYWTYRWLNPHPFLSPFFHSPS